MITEIDFKVKGEERKKLAYAIGELLKEAAEYFNIGIKKMRRLAEDNEGEFAIYMGNRYLVIRERFEQYIVNLSRGGEDEEEWKIKVQEWRI